MDFRLQQLQKSFLNTAANGMLIISEVNGYWLTGFKSSFRYVLINKQGNVIFITDPRYFLAAQSAMKQYKNVEVWSIDVEHPLINQLKAAKQQLGIDEVLIEEEYVTLNDLKIITQVFDHYHPFNSRSMRSIKDESALNALRASAGIIVKVMDWVRHTLKPGISEKSLATQISMKILELGASGNSFSPIVAAGLNGASPHHQPSDYVIQDGDFVTIDIGCMYQGYASDMTRTFLVGKEPSNQEMLDIYNLVYESQTSGVKAAKPGISGKELDMVCREIIDKTSYQGLFAHGTGHGVGMEVHELPNVNKGNTVPLVSNSVVTVEPGIYKEHVGGVRIEDTLIINDHGCEVITDYPKELIRVCQK